MIYMHDLSYASDGHTVKQMEKFFFLRIRNCNVILFDAWKTGYDLYA